MAQYDFLSRCRVPAENMDIPRQTEVERSKHVIVVRNGHVSMYVIFTAQFLPQQGSISDQKYLIGQMPDK